MNRVNSYPATPDALARPDERLPGEIPRRIIHVYCPPDHLREGIPLLYRAALASSTLLNPGFEHLLFDRPKMEAFLRDEPESHQQAIKSFRFPIQRFDFFRYLAVYRLGGVYMDLDVFLAQSVVPLLCGGCVFPFEELTLSRHLRKALKMDWELGNYAFGACPGDPFLKAIIQNCMRAQTDPSWAEPMLRDIPRPFRDAFFVVNTTGPGLVSRTFAEHPELQSGVTVLFPDDVCDLGSWHRFGNYGIHLMNASWRKRPGYVYTRLLRFWEGRKRNQLLRESLRLGPRRNGNWKTELCSDADLVQTAQSPEA